MSETEAPLLLCAHADPFVFMGSFKMHIRLIETGDTVRAKTHLLFSAHNGVQVCVCCVVLTAVNDGVTQASGLMSEIM